MGYVSKVGWIFVWGEAQSLAYICVLFVTNLIEQPCSPFQQELCPMIYDILNK
jgi:hypothetical protein